RDRLAEFLASQRFLWGRVDRCARNRPSGLPRRRELQRPQLCPCGQFSALVPDPRDRYLAPYRRLAPAPHELVYHPDALGRRVLGEPCPAAAGKLANIDIAVTVDGDAVRRGELAGGETGVHLAEPGQHLALGRMNADTRPDIGPVAVDL